MMPDDTTDPTRLQASHVLEAAVDELIARTHGHLVVAAPLGLGKPHRLLNAIYRRVAANPDLSLEILTALSLDPPEAGSPLERRFLDPFVARHFGEDFPRLDYTVAQKKNALPPNIWVEEFYLQSGSMLGSSQAQRSYSSLDYTHVARALAERGINVIVKRWRARRLARG